MWAILWFLVIGFFAGLLARAIVPGKDALGLIRTVVLGVVGSYIGGALGAVFSDSKITEFNTAGLILSVVGAIIALLIYRKVAAPKAP